MTRSAGAAVALPAAIYPQDVEIDDIVRELAATTPCAVVTSCYLNLDRARRPRPVDCLHAFEALAVEARRRGDTLGPSQRKTVERDLEAIRDWLVHLPDRQEISGVACFACSARGFLRVVPLPVAVPDRITIAAPPHLLPLELVAEEAPRFAVVLADLDQLRIVEARLGTLHPYPPIIEAPPAAHGHHPGGTVIGPAAAEVAMWPGGGTHADLHERGLFERHIAQCAEAVADHLRHHPADLLVIGGSEVMRAHLERALPAALRQLVAARVTMPVRTTLPQIRHLVGRLTAEIASRKDDDTLAELEFELEVDQAVTGLTGVLRALGEARVTTLVVEVSPPVEPGAICLTCERISPPSPTCPACGSPTTPVDDVFEEAVERALNMGARVRVLRSGRRILAEDGIAALLRDSRRGPTPAVARSAIGVSA